MHNYIVNASLQVLPIVKDRHPYEWVDEAIKIIKQSNLKFEVGAFATVVEGKYNDVLKVVDAVNEHLYSQNCNEWILNVHLQIRSNEDITADEKTAKHK